MILPSVTGSRFPTKNRVQVRRLQLACRDGDRFSPIGRIQRLVNQRDGHEVHVGHAMFESRSDKRCDRRDDRDNTICGGSGTVTHPDRQTDQHVGQNARTGRHAGNYG